MTDQTRDTSTGEDSGRHEGRVDAAMSSLESTRLDIEAAVKTAQAAVARGDDVPKGLIAAIKDLQRATLVAVEAEWRAEDARSKANRGGGLDLGAARAEIERRLAGLRGAECAA